MELLNRRSNPHDERDAFRARLGREQVCRAFDSVGQIEIDSFERELPSVKLRKIEDIIDDAQ